MTMESSGGNDVVEIDVVNVGEIDGKLLSPPVHMQAAMKHLQLHPLLHYIQNLLKDGGPKRSKIAPASMMPSNNKSSQTFGGLSQGVKIVSGVPITRAERIADRGRLYNFSRVRKKRKWMKNLLVDDSSDDEEKDRDQRIQSLLKHHKYRRACARDFRQGKHDRHFMYYSSSLLSNVDQHKERLESELATRVKTESSQQTESQGSEEDVEENDDYSDWLRHRRRRKRRRLSPEQAQVEQKNIWSSICKDFIPSAYKTRTENRRENMVKLKRVSSHCMRECRRVGLQSQKLTKESMARARKLAREAGNYWRKKDRNEKETKRKTDKEADEHRKQEMAVTEAQRQKRKLDFLITQTELYAHFMAGKITGQGDEYQAKILEQLPTDGGGNGKEHGSGDSSPFDSRSLALANAQEAFNLHASKRRAFSTTVSVAATTTTTATAETSRAVERQQQRQQPSMFNGILKAYQLDGMNWLVRLYEEGLNGILADEMGLGKTIQSLAFLAHLAETCNIWGPFLVVAPASTLHNWQQECARFLPKFKCVPYWGNAQDRKVLRKFWETSGISTEEGSFHVVITSYQIVVQDVRYFQKIDWHYLILDEAQAIKSSSSARWKILLGFTCRNRLLLTGTPIQNNMAELWSLLHFIMPTLFDCHEEFNEWFSKDIESLAENRKLHYDRNQLSRLRLILSPFMLRREKKEVENQLSEKIEIIVRCPLTSRQKILYEALKNKISIDDLLSSSRVPAQATVQTNTLMNLVMQFRKVCNHPDLIDRRQTYCGSKMEPEQFVVPRLLYPLLNPSFDHVLYNRLYIHHPANIAESLREHREGSSDGSGFSFSRFVGLSPGEVYRIYSSLMLRWLAVLQYWELAETVYLSDEWEGSRSRNSSRMMLLDCQRITSPPSVMASVLLSTLIFTSTLMTSYGHVDHTVKSMSETSGHRRIRLRERRNVSEKRHRSHKSSAPVSPSRSPARVVSPSRSAPVSPTKSRSKSTAPSTSTEPVSKDESLLVHPHKERPDRVLPSLLTDWPKFTYLGRKKVHFPPRSWYCADRSADSQRRLMNGCGSLDAMRTLLYGSSDLYEDYERRNERFVYRSTGGLLAAKPWHGYSSVIVPEKESVVTDAGKLRVLDQLLTRLKSEGHRVLIYSQMTRMIDILEQYMWIRKHTYMRLDGSSKISERRDMIADFQSREDIFVFLLSTRAGGLGINLTAADTVIFYDSDWNPAVDKQAMDRAHRLGQTRQVTVYRLVTENSIEQRILERAEAKSQIQNMVMNGSSAVAPDALKPTEVVNLLLDDAELRSKFKEKNDDVAKGGRLANDGRESVQSSGTTSPGSSSVLSEQASSVLAHNDSSSDDAALFIAEEAGGNNDRSPKRRGRPGRGATPKRTSQGKAVVKQQQMSGGSGSSTGVEMVDGGSGSRAASLRTRSTNQTPGPHPPANE